MDRSVGVEVPPGPDVRPEVLGADRSATPTRRPASLDTYRPMLWGVSRRSNSREERPRYERDSLRTRSRDPVPGSRKHKRWSQSVHLVDSLRRQLALAGEDDPLALEAKLVPQDQPSAFRKLIEAEGAEGALDAWAAAEAAVAAAPARRGRRTEQTPQEVERSMRRGFADNWHFIQSSDAARGLLTQLEDHASLAFGDSDSSSTTDMEWLLRWTCNDALETEQGTPPAHEIAIQGLSPAQRKLAHQLARVLGLHSESRQNDSNADEKVFALRPPRQRVCGSAAWRPPFSVAKLLPVSTA